MSNPKVLGELAPVGGGDVIPLVKPLLKVGRRESCDIVLRFPNVSAHHCLLTLSAGYWFVKDMDSRNGIKLNGVRVRETVLRPGDMLFIARHQYEVRYSPADLGAVGPPPYEESSDMFHRSLLERAGIEKSKLEKSTEKPKQPPGAPKPQSGRSPEPG
jgi:adenylate cyclase